MSIIFRYKQIERPKPLEPVVCPVIPVTLRGKEQLDVLALIDSGADTVAIPQGIAEILGLDMSGKREPVMGVGGEGEAINSRVDVCVQKGHEKYFIQCDAKIILGEDGEDHFPVLLGRQGFFENFDITFKEKKRKVILKKV